MNDSTKKAKPVMNASEWQKWVILKAQKLIRILKLLVSMCSNLCIVADVPTETIYFDKIEVLSPANKNWKKKKVLRQRSKFYYSWPEVWPCVPWQLAYYFFY